MAPAAAGGEEGLMALQREQVVRNAEKLASRGRIDAAIREYRKVLAEAPDDVATLNRVGDLYARADRNDDAIKLYTQIAESYTEEGFFVKAIAIYKKIIKLDPTRLEIYEKLASLYHRQGLLNEARTQYQVLADYYLKHDNTTSAIAIYERMAEVDPQDPSLRVKLADLYLDLKLPEKALGEYRSIAETMLAAGHPGEAEQVYRRALDVDASNIGFITDAVLKLREAGQVAPAARLLAEATARNPEAAKVARLVGMAAPAAGEAAAEEATEEAAEAPAAEAAEAAAGQPAVEAPPAAAPAEEAGEDAALVLDLDADEALPSIDLGLEGGSAAVEEPPAAVEAQPAPAAAPEPPPSTRYAAPGAPVAFGEELELDLDEVFELDFDEDEEPPDTQVHPPPDLAGSTEPPPALRRADRPAGGLGLDPDALERTAAEIQPERIRQEEDLLTEAEVLSKYGLAEKAAERLAELLEINPTHVGGLALKVRFDLDSGQHAAAAAAAERLRTIADERSEAWTATVERLQAAGHEIAADRVVPPAEEAATLPGARAGDGEERAAAEAPAASAAAVGATAAEVGEEDAFADLAELDLSGLPGFDEAAEAAEPAGEVEGPPPAVEPAAAAGGPPSTAVDRAPSAAEAAAEPAIPPAATPGAAPPPSADAPAAEPQPAPPASPAVPAERGTDPGTGRRARRDGPSVDALLAEIASGVGRRRRDRRPRAAAP
ncbi:MAG TPA: tetratricopeptide repeat protein, partial [Thermoanaerobaculia bacterium]